jgi:hypothetical protein
VNTAEHARGVKGQGEIALGIKRDQAAGSAERPHLGERRGGSCRQGAFCLYTRLGVFVKSKTDIFKTFYF